MNANKVNDTNYMHVVFICDNNYAMPTGIAITSLYETKKSTSNYMIHIICNDVSDYNINKLRALSKEGFIIDIISKNGLGKFKDLEAKTEHVSFAACNKFDLPEIFASYDRILYLDCDIIFQKDISELYNEDLTGIFALVVKDKKPETYNPPICKKLKINHKFYFNTGVMMLNLERMRQYNMSDKLFEYRKNGINFFMDQDAFNVVFKEEVKYISFLYNMILTNVDHFSIEEICNYYELNPVTDKLDMFKDAYIIHLASKYKPWKYNVPFFTNLYFHYYNQSPYKDEKIHLQELPSTLASDSILREQYIQEIPQKFLNDSRYNEDILPPLNGINTQPREEKIVVSLTTIPERINKLYIVLKRLLQQKMKPDTIIVYLADTQFQKDELPFWIELYELVGIKFEFCDDLKPHKKYFYAMQKFPNDILITVDDDVLYPNNLINILYNTHLIFPRAVIARRVHKITQNKYGKIDLYENWKQRSQDHILEPSMRLLATGVCGVLYPPHALASEAFNKEAIIKCCLHTDDMWLKIMEVLNQTPVVLAEPLRDITYIDGTQESGLYNVNVKDHRNDIELSNILKYFDGYFGNSFSIEQYIFQYAISDKEKNTVISALCKQDRNRDRTIVRLKKELEMLKDSKIYSKKLEQLNKEIKKLDKDNNKISNKLRKENKKYDDLSKAYRDMENSWSFKIGRIITFLPRKFRDLFK